MYLLQTVVFILCIRSSSSSNNNMLSSDVRSCLSRSLERVILEQNQDQLDCATLSSETRIVLAIHFTFCHLNSTGIDSNLICSLTAFDKSINECLKNITKNSFAYLTYTNFVPHIQSICYSIETQQWHNHMRNTVSKINLHSRQIENELKTLLIEQETMQVTSDQALIVNQNSIDDALNVDRFLQAAQSDVDELRGHIYVKDKVQMELIQQILEILVNIQTSLFTDAFGLSSYVFYAMSLITIHVLTIPERTCESKFWLIIMWLCLIGVERYILIFSTYSQILLYDVLWRLRQLWFFVSCLTLTYYAVQYRDYFKENQKLIDEIGRKHRKLEITARQCLNVINQLDISDDSVSDDTSNDSSENNNVSTSTSNTDDDE